MTRLNIATGVLLVIAAFVLGIGVEGARKGGQSPTYEVRPAERCIPDEGWDLVFKYDGRGQADIKVLPPTEAPKAASKEKK